MECLSVQDQLLITLTKIKCNLTHVDLAVRFGVSKETVRNITTTYICFLHEYLFHGVIVTCGIPSQLKNQACLPQSFSTCRIILDCTEVQVVVPRSSMAQQKQTFSHYKQRNTLTALFGVAPNGWVYGSRLKLTLLSWVELSRALWTLWQFESTQLNSTQLKIFRTGKNSPTTWVELGRRSVQSTPSDSTVLTFVWSPCLKC